MSATLQSKREEAIREGYPITVCGITLYPITVKDYPIFCACKNSLILRQSTFPVRLLSKMYLSAIFGLEIEAANSKDEGNKNIGIFSRLIRLLCLSMDIEYNVEQLNKSIFYTKGNNGEYDIDHIELVQNGKTKSITSKDFSIYIRPIIAEQNGLELPDESENADILEANEIKKSLGKNQRKLKENFDDLVASVCLNYQQSEEEIYKLTVKKFDARIRAIERNKRYEQCAIAEMSGMAEFKSGNPCPSWCYDAIDDTYGTVSYEKLQNSFGGAPLKT